MLTENYKNRIQELAGLLREEQKEMILFHGTLYDFKKFKNRNTFFSDNPNFAYDYAATKSMDMALDADVVVLKCKFSGNLFDPNNEKEYNELVEKLPEKIKVYDSTGIFDHDFDKKDVIERLRGFETVQPLETMLNAKVGDKVPDPTYNPHEFLVIKRDNDWVYTIHYTNLIRDVQINSAQDNFKPGVRRVYSVLFDKYRKYREELVKEKSGKSYVWDNYIDTTIYYAQHKMEDIGITEAELKEIDRLHEEGKKALMDLYIEEKKYRKWNLKPIVEKLSDTWRYFENETVANIIHELKYDGYVAKERGHNTYLVYDPNKTITILERT